MHNYRKFKDYHIERLRDSENAKIYFSVACDDYKKNKDVGAFLLAVSDVAEARGINFDDFLKEVGIFEEAKSLAQERQFNHGSRFWQMKKNKYSGSNFDDLLKEEGIFDEVKALAQKELSAEGSLKSDQNSEDMKDPTKPITRFFRWIRHIFNL